MALSTSRLKYILGDSDFKEILSKGLSYILIRGLGIIINYAFIAYITKSFGASVFGLFFLFSCGT